MIILFFVCVAQITFGLANISISSEDQDDMAKQRWMLSDDIIKEKLQLEFVCCTFDKTYYSFQDAWDQSPCADFIHRICCDESSNSDCSYCACRYKMQNTLNIIFKLYGGLAIFFGLVQIIGVAITVRYRNQKSPRSQAGAFL